MDMHMNWFLLLQICWVNHVELLMPWLTGAPLVSHVIMIAGLCLKRLNPHGLEVTIMHESVPMAEQHAFFTGT